MKTSFQVLSERETGQIPVSIGTSLAIESILGIYPEKETNNPAIRKIDDLWINVRTLLRNMIGAVPTEDKVSLDPNDLINSLKEEMVIIKDVIDKQSLNQVNTTFYICSFRSLLKDFKRAVLKFPKTERQKFIHAIEKHVVDFFLKEEDNEFFKKFDINIKTKSRKTLMLTHQPIDLLSRYGFIQLRLLESHTGNIKGPTEWTTKLTGGKNLTRIPFNKLTLQVFGDGEMFSTFPMKLKKELIEIAEKEKWTFNTTMEKMRYGISKAYDPDFKILMIDLMR